MWVNCHECAGSGYNLNDSEDIIYHEGSNIPFFYCLHCYIPPIDRDIWELFRGQLWLEDTIEPVDEPDEPTRYV